MVLVLIGVLLVALKLGDIGPQSPSSTAPWLALAAFFANLASTPRV
jgi:hypothetical protein